MKGYFQNISFVKCFKRCHWIWLHKMPQKYLKIPKNKSKDVLHFTQPPVKLTWKPSKENPSRNWTCWTVVPPGVSKAQSECDIYLLPKQIDNISSDGWYGCWSIPLARRLLHQVLKFLEFKTNFPAYTYTSYNFNSSTVEDGAMTQAPALQVIFLKPVMWMKTSIVRYSEAAWFICLWSGLFGNNSVLRD